MLSLAQDNQNISVDEEFNKLLKDEKLYIYPQSYEWVGNDIESLQQKLNYLYVYFIVNGHSMEHFSEVVHNAFGNNFEIYIKESFEPSTIDHQSSNLLDREGIDYVDFLRHHYVIMIDNDNNWN